MANEKAECSDKKCPFHGKVTLRGKVFEGTVVSLNPHKTAIIEWGRLQYLQKYERYEKRKTKIAAHNSPCMSAKKGDLVEIKECRPLSKTKNFVITRILGKNIEFMEREERVVEEVKKPAAKKKEAAAQEENIAGGAE